MRGGPLQSQGGLGTPLSSGRQCSRSRSARRHQIPTGLHANLSEGRPVGPARHGASSLLSSDGFFLGKMRFREAVTAGDVALSQVRKRGCKRMFPLSRLRPEGIVMPPGAEAGAGCFPGSNTGAVTQRHREGSSSVAALELSRCLLPSPLGTGRAGGPAEPLPGITGQEPHSRGRAPARARSPRCMGLMVPGRRQYAQVEWEVFPVGGQASSDSAPPTGVCQVFAEALQAHGVRFTRLPLERGVGACTWLEAPARSFACAVERDARAAVGPFSRRGLRSVPLPSSPHCALPPAQLPLAIHLAR